VEILITGNLGAAGGALARRLLNNGHTVIAAASGESLPGIKHSRFSQYDVSRDSSIFTEVFRSHTFEHVLFLTANENRHIQSTPASASMRFNDLDIVLEHCAQYAVQRFTFLSSLDVYGESQDMCEKDQPQPETRYGQLILNGEQLCGLYAKKYDMDVSILRVPFLYGPEMEHTFLGSIITAAKSKNKIIINANPLDKCGFLHIDDLYSIVDTLIEEDADIGIRVFNLALDEINYSFLTQHLNIHIPKTEFLFSDTEEKNVISRKIKSGAAEKLFAWEAEHDLIDDLPDLIAEAEEKAIEKESLLDRLGAFARAYQPVLAWVEVLLGALLMHMLTVWSNTIIEFKIIDFRLLYVVIIGATHGLLYGVAAALLAAASAAVSWNLVGLDWALLIYNVENWIPFALYFLAGAVTGYVHDKQENEIIFERKQTQLIHDKYEFLYSLYNEITTIKDRLREQLVGYRDSFGRFFRITNELNELKEDAIFLKALEIIEDLMKNDQIAIYSIEQTQVYGRLVVKSKTMNRPIPKSLKLSDFSAALDVVYEGNVFQNKNLLPNFPSYIAPIMNVGKLIGIVVIWEATFEQLSMYYLNLFKVITGLVESSLVRAATFQNAQTDMLFLNSTQIMKPAPFKLSLETRKKMRRSKIADFQILQVEKGRFSWKGLYDRLRKGIRTEDLVGVLSEEDPHCYVILTNAGVENLPIIQERLDGFNLSTTVVEDLGTD